MIDYAGYDIEPQWEIPAFLAKSEKYVIWIYNRELWLYLLLPIHNRELYRYMLLPIHNPRAMALLAISYTIESYDFICFYLHDR